MQYLLLLSEDSIPKKRKSFRDDITYRKNWIFQVFELIFGEKSCIMTVKKLKLWEIDLMEFQKYFPIWNKLSDAHKEQMLASLYSRTVKKGTVLHDASMDCTGLFLIKTGQLRAYILSEEGREITIYRLFDRDVCLFSASCMMRSIQFDITIEAEKDTDVWVIPVDVYQRIMEESASAANYTTEIMASRLSEAMWLIEQIMWKSLDKRVASFLLDEAAIEETDKLKITHEIIANHLGTHREVITRMLKYFQNEGMVSLSRGIVELTDTDKLGDLCD